MYYFLLHKIPFFHDEKFLFILSNMKNKKQTMKKVNSNFQFHYDLFSFSLFESISYKCQMMKILNKKVIENKRRNSHPAKIRENDLKKGKKTFTCFFSGKFNLMKRYINEQIWIGLPGSCNLQVTMWKLQLIM